MRRLDAVAGMPENNISCAIVDAINGYAWFGTNTVPGQIIKVALGTGYTPPVSLGSLILNVGENNLVSAVYDHYSETGFFGTNTVPGIVVKVNLGSGPALPTRVGALPLNAGENALYCAVIDNATQYAYFGTGTIGGRVVKIGLGIGLTPFARIGAVTLNSMVMENDLRCAVIDVTNGYAYFGTNTAPGRVVKVRLGAGAAAPTRIGSLGFAVGHNNLSTAVISVSSQFAWFGTNTLPGYVVKINLNGALTPTIVGAVTLNAGEGNLYGATIDVANQAAWFGTNTTPGGVVKVDIGAGNAAPSRLGAIALPVGEDLITCGDIDVFNGYAYYGTNTSPAQVIRVALSQKGFVKGTQFTMPEPGLLDSVSFYSYLSAGDVRLSLYDTTADPDLIWEGPATLNTTVGDWLTTNVGDGLPASLLLAAGNYYLAWQVYTTASVPSHTVGAANEGFLVPYEWNGFPATLQAATPTEQVMTTDRWSAYITYTGPPNVQSVAVLDGHTVRVTFTKDMSADAELAATYTLSGSGQGSLAATPDSVAEVSPTEYDLSWNCPTLMLDGGDIIITVPSALTDTLGIPMGLTQSGTDMGGAVAALPTVTLVPNTEPVVGECSVALTLPARTWVDGCGAAIGETSVNLGGLDLANPQTGTYTVTFTATDGLGNVGTRPLSVEINDTTDPVITCPGDPAPLSLDVNCEAAVPDLVSLASAMDDCTLSPVITQLPVAGTMISADTVVTLRATDGAGNFDECTVNVPVVDDTDPVLTCPGDPAPLSLDVDCEAAVPDLVSLSSASDNCTLLPVITQLPAAGATITADTVVTLRATDGAGNFDECTVNVTVVDNTDPVLTCPGDPAPLSLDVDCEAAVPDLVSLASALDNCTLLPVITQLPVAGTTITADTVVTLRATDSVGNFDECTVNVMVVDDTDPVLTCPGDPATLSLDVNCEALVPNLVALASATDNCTASPLITQFPAAGATISADTVVTLRATDGAGNINECTVNVTVIDDTVPVLTCPGAPAAISLDADCEALVPNLVALASATDNCGAVITQSPVAGATITADTLVTLRAEDSAGNFDECTVNVTVVDDTNPVLSCPAAPGVISLDADCEALVPNLVALAFASDNCTLLPVITQLPAAGTTISTDTLVTLRATDGAGNFDECTVNVTVVDDTNPVLVCPGDPAPLSLDVNCEALVPNLVALASASDNCTLSPVITQLPAAGTTISTDTLVTLRATDGAGNFVECTVNVTVVDDTDPVLVCPGDPATISLDAICEAQVPNLVVLSSASDNCTLSPVITQLPAAGTTISADTLVTLRATDSAGNFDECTVNVTVVDDTPPVISLNLPNPQTINLSTPYVELGATATDNCDVIAPASITADSSGVNTSVLGTYYVYYDVDDSAGNSATTVSRTVYVVDLSNPGVQSVTVVNGHAVRVTFTKNMSADALVASNYTVSGTGLGTLSPTPNGVAGAGAVYNLTWSCPQLMHNGGTITVTVAAGVRDNLLIPMGPAVSGSDVGGAVASLPTATLIPPVEPVVGECSVALTLPSRSWADGCGTPISETSVNLGGLDPADPQTGGYTVTFTATDAAGNIGTRPLSVNILDTTDPVIVCPADPAPLSLDVNCQAVVSDLTLLTGATDSCSTPTITQLPAAGATIVSDTLVTLRATDAAGNFDECKVNVTVVDDTDPVITLQGANPQAVEINTAYMESGAVASDNCDVIAPGSIVIDASGVDTTTLGTYYVTYNVTDSAGNSAVEVQRTVNVVDTSEASVASVTVMDGHTVRIVFTKAMGAGAAIAASYTLSGTGIGTLSPIPGGVTVVNASTYDLTWSCPAIMRNGGHITVTVSATLTDSGGSPIVAPLAQTHTNGGMAQLPQITLVPDVTELTGECSIALAQPTRTATDACGNPATMLTAWNFDGLVFGDPTLGTYTITYRAQDAAGNLNTRNLTVYIEDTTAPAITLLGTNPQVIDLNDLYVEQGATAADSCEGNLTAGIVIDASAVNIAVAGTYTVTYNVQDSEGNAAVEVTRNVEVVDNSIPLSVAPIADIEIADGGNGTLSAIPSGGTGPITYQWLKDDGTGTFVPLSEGSGYTGTQAATLTLDPFTAAMAGLYKVEVSDDLTTVEATANVTASVPQIPAAGLFGMLALATAAALGGVRAMRRRR